MADETSAKVVYFVRHGQSEDNVAPVFQSPDSPLRGYGQDTCKKVSQGREEGSGQIRAKIYAKALFIILQRDGSKIR